MNDLKVIELKGQRVLTTRQLAEAYETEIKVIQNNFQRNKDRYLVGKHYIYMDRDELREVKTTYPQFEGELKRTSRAHFWTEKGALLHAKSLNTDKAWEVYDYLVDFYFRAKEKQPEPEKKEVVPTVQKTEPIKRNASIPAMKEPVFIFKNLLLLAEEQGIVFKIKDIHGYFSILRENKIAVCSNLVFERVVYELAYELAHYFIHYKNGNLIDSPLSKDYNEQAERAAYMMITMLDIKRNVKY